MLHFFLLCNVIIYRYSTAKIYVSLSDRFSMYLVSFQIPKIMFRFLDLVYLLNFILRFNTKERFC